MSLIFAKSASFCDILRHSVLETRDWKLDACADAPSREQTAYFVRGSLGCNTPGKMPKMLHFVAFCCMALHAG